MSIQIYPIRGIPEVVPGDDLAVLIIEGLETSQISLFERDVLVITHKVVSKAEGRIESAPDDRAYRNRAEREARSILRRQLMG
jgi:coenzyme F420-0:L-glutamate ligase/coenzyme F420-1:gamma-L-glutamate ligase